MYEHNRPWPAVTIVFRVLAWLVGVAMLIQFWSLGQDHRVSFELSSAAYEAVGEDIESRLARFDSLGPAYQSADYVRDSSELMALADLLKGYRLTGDQAMLSRQAWVARDSLNHRWFRREQAAHRAISSIGFTGFGVADARDGRWHQLRSEHWRPAYLHELPVIAVRPLWLRFLTRWGTAWLATLPIALLGIAVSFWRLKKSFLAEWLFRPWVPALNTVFWWYGLGSYVNGSSVVQDRLDQLVRQFKRVTGCEPTKAEAQVLYAQAAGPLVVMNRVLARVCDVPEAVEAQSRRAVLASWIATAIAAPVQFLTTVTVTVAQAARATASSAVDSTRTQPRPDRRHLWGVFHVRARREGVDIPWNRVFGTSEIGPIVTKLELDPLKPKVLAASVTYRATPSLALTGGRVVCPTTYDYPPPFVQLPPKSPLDDLNPNFHDFGGFVTLSRGGATTQVGLLNGEGTAENVDERLDAVVRFEQRAGPITASVCWQRELSAAPTTDYRSAFVVYDGERLSGTVAHAIRDDLGTSASHVRLAYRDGPWRFGAQAERPLGLTLSLERSFGGKNRLMLHGIFREQTEPQFELRIQRALEFVNN